MLQFQSGSLDLYKVDETAQFLTILGHMGSSEQYGIFFSNYELLPTFGGGTFHVFMDKNIFLN